MHIQLLEAVVVERCWSWAGLGSNPNSATYLSKSWVSIFSPKKEGNTEKIIVNVQWVDV